MNQADLPLDAIKPAADPGLASSLPRTLVKQLHPGHKARLLDHFIQLEEDDRYLRFGRPISDESIAGYVDHIDWSTDTVFGVFDVSLALVGVAHLARLNDRNSPHGHQHCAEFGVSVLPSARGRGVGTRLFDRAIVHARNADIQTFYMQCLAYNKTMMRIARKAGMSIEVEQGEANAYLTLPQPHLGTHIAEAFEEQLAAFDLRLKKQLRSANDRLTDIAQVLNRAA